MTCHQGISGDIFQALGVPGLLSSAPRAFSPGNPMVALGRSPRQDTEVGTCPGPSASARAGVPARLSPEPSPEQTQLLVLHTWDRSGLGLQPPLSETVGT